MVEVVESWNGRMACALQLALHMSNEAFAQRIGAHVRTIAGWHENEHLVPRPDMQQALDTLLAHADDGARARFAARTSGAVGGEHPGREIPAAAQRPEPIFGSIYLGPDRDLESSRRTLLAQSLAGGEAPPEFSLLELADTIRREMEDTLASGSVSPARLTHIEEIIASHVRLYTTTPPAAALAGLLSTRTARLSAATGCGVPTRSTTRCAAAASPAGTARPPAGSPGAGGCAVEPASIASALDHPPRCGGSEPADASRATS